MNRNLVFPLECLVCNNVTIQHILLIAKGRTYSNVNWWMALMKPRILWYVCGQKKGRLNCHGEFVNFLWKSNHCGPYDHMILQNYISNVACIKSMPMILPN